VNSVCVQQLTDSRLLVTGGDDNLAKLWDMRLRASQMQMEHEFQVLSVAISAEHPNIFTAGLDSVIRCWDMRTTKNVLYTLDGHSDAVTGLELSADSAHLLSNSMDNTVRSWDVRPFVTTSASGRHEGTFVGHLHDIQQNLLKCAWSPDGQRIGAGSADRLVYVWDVASSRVSYKLPGHAGTVNEIDFHPTEPIIMSVSDDRNIYLGEIAH